jgi:hypothetical protein
LIIIQIILIKAIILLYKTIPLALNKLFKALHVVDANGDGLDDIIYEGTGGWETNKVMLYINTGKAFKLIFVDQQYVKKIEFKNGKLWRLYTFNPGCCDGYMVFNKIFEFSYKGKPNDFEEIFSTAYYKDSEQPATYLGAPINFSVTADSCIIRTKPEVSTTDTLILAGDLHIGNDIGTIYKGATGRTIAKQTDKNGKEWWYVEMSLKTKTGGNVFYNELSEDDFSGKMGWLNSADIKR